MQVSTRLGSMCGWLPLLCLTLGGLSPSGAHATPGACCLECPNGCVLLEQAQCIGVGGDYQGDGTTCDSNPCAVTGACCLPFAYACEVASMTDCDTVLGTYQGDCTACEPNPCVPGPAVERHSWGAIKRRYR